MKRFIFDAMGPESIGGRGRLAPKGEKIQKVNCCVFYFSLFSFKHHRIVRFRMRIVGLKSIKSGEDVLETALPIHQVQNRNVQKSPNRDTAARGRSRHSPAGSFPGSLRASRIMMKWIGAAGSMFQWLWWHLSQRCTCHQGWPHQHTSTYSPIISVCREGFHGRKSCREHRRAKLRLNLCCYRLTP